MAEVKERERFEKVYGPEPEGIHRNAASVMSADDLWEIRWETWQAAVASHAPATAGSERNELLHELECWGVIYDPQQVVEGEEPWEVICEPEPQYFDTFKEAFKFFMSLKDNPERDSPAPSAPATGKELTEVRCGKCNAIIPGGIDLGHECVSSATQGARGEEIVSGSAHARESKMANVESCPVFRMSHECPQEHYTFCEKCKREGVGLDGVCDLCGFRRKKFCSECGSGSAYRRLSGCTNSWHKPRKHVR